MTVNAEAANGTRRVAVSVWELMIFNASAAGVMGTACGRANAKVRRLVEAQCDFDREASDPVFVE